MRYSEFVKRILLIALFVLGGHAAHAQSFGVTLGGRLEGVPFVGNADGTLRFVPMLGVDVGAEVRFAPITVGVRLAVSSLLLLIWHGQADLYAGYTLPEGLMLYTGLGYSLKAFVFGGVNEDVHALLGVRFPGGWWLEVTPGIGFAAVCDQSQVQPGQGCSSEKTVRGFVIGLNFGITLIF